MSLSAFIRDQHEEIIREFTAFARTLMPPGADMSEEQLRDHAADILTAVVHDMSIAQTSNEQTPKSQVAAPPRPCRTPAGFTRMIAFSTDFRSGSARGISCPPRDRPSAVCGKRCGRPRRSSPIRRSH